MSLVYPFDFSADLPQRAQKGWSAIYGLLTPEGLLRYIGQSVQPRHRLKAHYHPDEMCLDTHKSRWLRAMLSEDRRAVLQVLLWVPRAEVDAAEVAYIAEARRQGYPLTNSNDGGNGNRGHVPSARTRALRGVALRAYFEGLSLEDQQAQVQQLLAAGRDTRFTPERAREINLGRERPLTEAMRQQLVGMLERRWAEGRDRSMSGQQREKVSAGLQEYHASHSVGEETRARLSAAIQRRWDDSEHYYRCVRCQPHRMMLHRNRERHEALYHTPEAEQAGQTALREKRRQASTGRRQTPATIAKKVASWQVTMAVRGDELLAASSVRTRERWADDEHYYTCTRCRTPCRLRRANQARHDARFHTPAADAARELRQHRPLSDEHRAKLSAAAMGRSPSPETREKLRQAFAGRPLSPEALAKRAATNARKRAERAAAHPG